jgi:hypothetical protein
MSGMGEPPQESDQGGPPGSQPAYYGGYSPPGWEPRYGRRRRRLRGAIYAGATAGIIAIIGGIFGVIFGNGSDSSDNPSIQVSVTPFPSASMLAKEPVGSAVVLTGNGAGEKVAVTVVKVFSHPRGATDFDTADQGDRLYAVQFRLDDTGSMNYSDAPSNSATVVDAAGKSYQSSLDDVAGCTSFPATEKIPAGQSGLGCIVFEVPASAQITLVQFTLDSGFGPATGQWTVAS